MDDFRVLLLLHVVIVVVALAVTFAYPLMPALAEQNGVAATRFTLKLMHKVEDFVVLPGALLLFVVGAGLVVADNGSAAYKDDFPIWLGIAIAWFVAAFTVAVLVQRRNLVTALRSLEHVPDGPALPDDYVPVGKRMQLVGAALGLSIIGITFLMVLRPGG